MELYNGDCIEVMQKLIDDGVKVDMILTDPPYGVTKNKKDKILDLVTVWKLTAKLLKPNGVSALFGQGKFYIQLVNSNMNNYKYDLVWDKQLKSGFLNANRMPLRQHEQIAIFYNSNPVYNPQKSEGLPSHSKGSGSRDYINNNYSKHSFVDNGVTHGSMKFPTSLLSYAKPHPSVCLHPTQKPVDLLEYLIKTYTNENELVLDFTMGSGSTGVACLNTNRNFIGIELDKGYFDIASKRIEDTQKERGIYENNKTTR